MVLKTGVDNSPKKLNLRGEGMATIFFLLCIRFVLEHTTYQHPIVIAFNNPVTTRISWCGGHNKIVKLKIVVESQP